MSDEVVLYRNSKNGISRWTIWQEDNVICMKSEAKIGDSPMYFTEEIKEGKASRSLQQQIDLRTEARIRGKVDNGYVRTREEAKNPGLKNVMGLHQPMLAQKFKDAKSFKFEDHYMQPKLDGHRCLITRQGSELIAYSRRGRVISTVDHILKDINIPEGTTLDGELYVHGEPLQTIASWAKRKQPNSEKLKYVIFDIIEDIPYEDRVKRLFNDLDLPVVDIASHFTLPVVFPRSEEHVFEYFRESRDNGYEGIMLKNRTYAYEIGRRSRGLLKMKETHDDEFEVIDVSPSVDGWGVLHCRTVQGKVFRVSAPGTVPQKKYVLENKYSYIGAHITIEYAHLTKEGIPFHPNALRWRLDL